jgi:hypothetical protein
MFPNRFHAFPFDHRFAFHNQHFRNFAFFGYPFAYDSGYGAWHGALCQPRQAPKAKVTSHLTRKTILTVSDFFCSDVSAANRQAAAAAGILR